MKETINYNEMTKGMKIDLQVEKRRINSLWFMGFQAVLLIAVFTLSFVFFTIRSNNIKTQVLENRTDLLIDLIERQERRVSDISKQISENPQSVDANINKVVEKLDSDYKKLQEIIIGNPSNIIEFALLINKVDNLKESYKEHKDAIYKEMDRNFGLFQWFIYMNIFIILAILGMTVTIYYQGRDQKKKSRLKQK